MTRLLKKGLATAAFAATLGAQGADAGTIIVFDYTIEAAAKVDGAGPSDFTKPVATANQTTSKASDTITANAVQNTNGFSSVETKVSHAGMDGFAAGGYNLETTAEARAFRQVNIRNAGTTATDLGRFDFRISGVELEVFNGGGFFGQPNFPKAEVSFSAFVFGGGSYSASMTLTGRYDDFQIEDQERFTGTVDRQECSFGVCLKGVVTVDPLVGSLNLGVLAPGEEVIVVTDLIVKSTFYGTEDGAGAKAVDPNGLSYYTVSFDTPAPIPLPAAGWLMLAGLGGLAALRRRRG